MSSRALSLIALCTVFTACGAAPDAAQTEDALRKKKCHSNADCSQLQFCDTEASGTCDGKGVCTPRGINLFCTNIDIPVCGCDGQNYPNDCYAHKAGVSVAAEHACAVVCTDNSGCASLQYCKKVDGNCGGKGYCQPRGITLFCSNIYLPVCGCDGKTYSNACVAQKAGASIDHQGACACDFTSTTINGDTLAEQPFMNQTQSFFYTFTGDGTIANNSGTVVSTFSPPCLRTTPHCAIATRQKTGTFVTSGSTLTISYSDGTSATFDAQTDCNNSLQLVGFDWNQAMTLTISTIQPAP